MINIQIEDKGEAFDWAWALWYWLSHNYNGMHCPKYASMCKLTSTYQLDKIPSIDFENNDCDEYEMAVMYYHELDEDDWEEYFNVFCNYMDNDWEKEIA